MAKAIQLHESHHVTYSILFLSYIAGQKQKRTLRTPMATPNQSSRITPVLRSTRRGSSSRYPVNTQPLIGENIVLAKGSHRSLVLTHGGIRCNEHIDEAVPGAIN